MDSSVRSFLLELSRKTIISGLKGSDVDLSGTEIPGEAAAEGACFVTLTINGELRGCIGSIEAHRPLYKDVMSNSLNAAFEDPRFPPVSDEEAENILIEISVLTPRKEIEYADFDDLKKKIIPNRHGVYLTHSFRSATFLPQVWEQLPDHDEFFAHLCFKAGISKDAFIKSHPKVEVYTVENFTE